MCDKPLEIVATWDEICYRSIILDAFCPICQMDFSDVINKVIREAQRPKDQLIQQMLHELAK